MDYEAICQSIKACFTLSLMQRELLSMDATGVIMRSAVLSPAFTNTRSTKSHQWHPVTKSAYYATFTAVDRATWSSIG